MESSLGFRSLVDVVRHHAVTRGDKTAYVFLEDGEREQSKLTFAELDLRCRALAARLSAERHAGERVLLVYESGLDFVVAFLGCLFAEVVPVPLHPPRGDRPLDRLEAVFRDADATLLLSAGAVHDVLAKNLAESGRAATLPILNTGDIGGGETGFLPRDIAPETLAFLQYTSGSTGDPKGVMVTHANLLHNEAKIARSFADGTDGCWVGWLPLFHDMGLIGNVLQPLYLGIPSVLMSPMAFLQKPVRWLAAIAKYGGTVAGAPNFAYELCARKVTDAQCEGLDLSRWRLAYNGAEPVRADTLTRFAARFAPYGFRMEVAYPCYGMAEATLIISGGEVRVPRRVVHVDGAMPTDAPLTLRSGPNETSRSFVSCGHTHGMDEVVVADPESRRALPDGHVGEIWVRGASVAKGYFRREALTQEIFGAVLADGRGPFLRTGDLGFALDGELFVAGRMKDVIIVRGRNHYPQDIESTIGATHAAFVPGGSAAFSVTDGEQEKLVVVQEVREGVPTDATAMLRLARRAIAEEHELTLHDLVLIPQKTIPKTTSGKIQRRRCRTLYMEGTLRRAQASEMEAR